MKNVDKWGLDVFRVADLTANRPLTVITCTILQVGVCQFLCVHLLITAGLKMRRMMPRPRRDVQNNVSRRSVETFKP